MTLNIVPFRAVDHYDIISEWWTHYKWPPLPLCSLPVNGLVAYYNNIPVVAAWVYRTDSDLGAMEWIISNPGVEKEIRNIAIEGLIEACINLAKDLKIRCLCTSVKIPKLISRLENAGFVVADKGMTNLIKEVR